MSKKFLNYNYSTTPEEQQNCFEEYYKYLQQMKDVFPPNAFEFASADWHYKGDHPQCPHDAWLETVEIREVEIEPGESKRDLQIEAKFLGAFHDGVFTITYRDVKKYLLNKAPLEFPPTFGNGHGDWLLDEVYLNDEGMVVHDIEFANNGRWTIYCGNIEYVWLPFSAATN